VRLKDERSRFGLPSFKALGASWVVCSELAERLSEPELATDPERLRERLATLPPLTLTCATEGNHGRAVAWIASVLHLKARVLVPAGTADARVRAIAAEGATVEVFDGDYDATVERAAMLADDRHVVISDMAWGDTQGPEPGDRGVRDRVRRARRRAAGPRARPHRHRHARRGLRRLLPRARIPCATGGSRARRRGLCARVRRRGTPGTDPCPYESVMAGLNCGTVSPAAWPAVSRAFDAFCAIDDADAEDGMRSLAAIGLDAGACAGAALGAACRLLTGPDSESTRRLLGVEPDAHVLVLLTEGVTDPEHFESTVGRATNTSRGDGLHATSHA